MIDEMMTLLESDDEAKAPTRQITGQKNLLSSRDAHIQATRTSIPEFDKSVTSVIEIRQMQQAEFVAAVLSCEATCEQADHPGEATIQFHSCVDKFTWCETLIPSRRWSL